MSHHRLTTPDLGRVFRGETVLGLSEWQLLERYLECRDEVAFDAIVARHGPMVLAVCRRMLLNQTDVEDAFQATFLVLVRRARQLGPRDALGAWLYGVATRVALRARCEAARRRRVEPIAHDFEGVIEDRSAADRELGDVLDQELLRLPSKYRDPVVLCYLEGHTHEEAARQLRWPLGTVKGRLSRARDLLQSRLVRRGVAPGVGALTLAFSSELSAALHGELLDRMIQSTLKLATGPASAQIASRSITSLVEGVLTAMFLNSLKWAGVAAVLCGLVFTGVGVMARQDTKAKIEGARPAAPEVAADAKTDTPAAKPAASFVAPEVPKSTGAPKIADLHKALLSAAAMEWDQAIENGFKISEGLVRAYQASRRLMDAQLAILNAPDQKLTSSLGHLNRIRELARLRHGISSPNDGASAQLKAYAAEAELWVAQAQAQTEGSQKREDADKVNKPGEARGKDPKSRLVLAKLDTPIPMPFIEDTALEDVLKYVKQSTTSETYPGIPIYVDPMGLQEAEKSMTSTVRNMDLAGIPLRRTLQILLKQLGLVYFVEDGILCITTENSEGTFGQAIQEPSPISEKTEKAERGELTLTEMKELIEVYKTKEQIRRLAAGESDEAKASGGGFGGAFHAGKGAVRTEDAPKPYNSSENKESTEAKRHGEETNLLLKEIRELIELLKAEKQTKQAPAVKHNLQ